MRGHQHRLVVEAHARIALLAVLIAPVGVVVAAAHQVVRLLDGQALPTLDDGRAEAAEADAVPLVDALLRAEVVGVGVERGAVHVPFLRPALGARDTEGPSVLLHARVVRGHDAVAIGPVGGGIAHTHPFAQFARAHVHLGIPTDAAEVVTRWRHAHTDLVPPGDVVEAGPVGPRRPTGLQVVHQHPVDAHQHVLRVEAADAEAGLPEGEARSAGEDVARGLQHPGDVLAAQLIVQVAGRDGEHRQLRLVLLGAVGLLGRGAVRLGQHGLAQGQDACEGKKARGPQDGKGNVHEGIRPRKDLLPDHTCQHDKEACGSGGRRGVHRALGHWVGEGTTWPASPVFPPC